MPPIPSRPRQAVHASVLHPARRARLALSLLAFAGLLAACGGDGGPAAPAGPTLVVGTDTARVGGLLRLTLRGAAAQGTLAGQVAGVAASVAAIDDSSLVLTVPDVAPGAQSITVTVGGRTATTSVDVLAALQIADPGAALVGAADAFVSLAPSTRPASMTEGEWTTYRARVDSIEAEVRAMIAEASPAQRLAVARWLASQGMTADFGADVRAGSSLAPDAGPAAIFGLETPCGQASLRAVRLSVIAVVSVAGFAAAVAVPADPISKSLAIGLTSLAAIGTVPEAKAAWRAVVDECSTQETVALQADPFVSAALRAPATVAGAATATGWQFQDGVALARYPGGSFRPVSAQDVPTDPRLSEGATLVERMHELLGMLPQVMRDLVPAPPARLSDLAPRPSVALAIAPNLVRIENVSPASVTVSAATAGDALRITATDPSNTVDLPFAFDVVSTTNGALRQRYEAVLQPAALRVTWIDGNPLPDTLRYTDGQTHGFRLGLASGGAASGIDYGQVAITGQTGSGATVALTRQADRFELRLANTTTTGATATVSFTVTYRGRPVQVVAATVSGACQSEGLFGTWSASSGYGTTVAGSSSGQQAGWNALPVWINGGNVNVWALASSVTIRPDTTFVATLRWYQTTADGTGRYGPGGNPIGGDVTTTWEGRFNLSCVDAGGGTKRLAFSPVSGVGTMSGTESSYDQWSSSDPNGVSGWTLSPDGRQLDWGMVVWPGVFLGSSFRATR